MGKDWTGIYIPVYILSTTKHIFFTSYRPNISKGSGGTKYILQYLYEKSTKENTFITSYEPIGWYWTGRSIMIYILS